MELPWLVIRMETQYRIYCKAYEPIGTYNYDISLLSYRFITCINAYDHSLI